MNNEIASFSGFLISHYIHMTYILVRFLSVLSCGIVFSLFLCAVDVAKRGVCDLRIKSQSLIFT